MSSLPLESMPLAGSIETPTKDITASSLSRQQSSPSPLTPADCRTLSKIFTDTCTSPTPWTSDTSTQNESPLGDKDVTPEDTSSESGYKDKVRHHQVQNDGEEEAGEEDEEF